MKKTKFSFTLSLCTVLTLLGCPAFSSFGNGAPEPGADFWDIDAPVILPARVLSEGNDHPIPVRFNAGGTEREIEVHFVLQESDSDFLTYKFSVVPSDVNAMVQESRAGNPYSMLFHFDGDGKLQESAPHLKSISPGVKSYFEEELSLPLAPVMKIMWSDKKVSYLNWDFSTLRCLGALFVSGDVSVENLGAPTSFSSAPNGDISWTFGGGELWKECASAPSMLFVPSPVKGGMPYGLMDIDCIEESISEEDSEEEGPGSAGPGLDFSQWVDSSSDEFGDF